MTQPFVIDTYCLLQNFPPEIYNSAPQNIFLTHTWERKNKVKSFSVFFVFCFFSFVSSYFFLIYNEYHVVIYGYKLHHFMGIFFEAIYDSKEKKKNEGLFFMLLYFILFFCGVRENKDPSFSNFYFFLFLSHRICAFEMISFQFGLLHC